jgi:hypothetical protein
MRYLKTYKKELVKAERWDYDYHEPPVLINSFDVSIANAQHCQVTHCQVAPADTQAKTWQRVCLFQRTTDRQSGRKTEGQPITAVWRNGGFSASYDSFVVG